MKTLCIFAFALLFTSCSHKSAQKNVPLPTTLDEAIGSPLRSPENVRRDIYRHPKETLEFFGLKPEMTVVEITPGAGWYTEILAPYLVTKGKYIMAVPELTANSPEYAKVNEQKVKAILEKSEAVEDKAIIAPFDPLNKDITVAETADMVVTFRNVHNWIGNNSADAAFKAFYRALKPGGILGVTDHLGKGKKVDFKSGYMTEKQVMDLAKNAGFKFVARSGINLNPKDSTKHPEGVWTLPPSLRLGEKDRAKYEAIGESNRMTLKFIKPQK
jgi:predicted methyltransferase